MTEYERIRQRMDEMQRAAARRRLVTEARRAARAEAADRTERQTPGAGLRLRGMAR